MKSRMASKAMCFSGLLVSVGCSGVVAGPSGSSTAAATRSDPLQMPADVVTYENTWNWGTHHLEWHTEREWDLLDSSDLSWAQQQGWKRADIQEGVAGNGFEFLVMHRAMLTILRSQFPNDTALFAGWTTPPTQDSSTDPLPRGATAAFDPNMQQAITSLTSNLAQFPSEDALGLYVETSLRPVAGNPSASASGPTTGLHNYMHNRFSNSNSAIDMGDPSKNLANQIFWRLHGWIDAQWTAYRALNNLSDQDPTYLAALQNAENMFQSSMSSGMTLASPPPASLTEFFENESNWGPAPTGSSGDDAGTGTNTGLCTGLGDGAYCGGDTVQGDPSTLYTCSGGNLSSTVPCVNGCQSNGSGTDACN